MQAKQVTRYRVEITEDELLDMVEAHIGDLPEGFCVKFVDWKHNLAGSHGTRLAHHLEVILESETRGITEAELEHGLSEGAK